MPDVEINGVAYRLAEDAEGEHYSLSAEPLRPPNAVTVQGEDSQKFQMRPDTLLWALSDWSGGEGQIKFDPENGNRWRKMEAVRVFEKPGTLLPGWAVKEATDWSSVVVNLRGALGESSFNDYDSNKGYVLSNSGLFDEVTLSGPAGGASYTICQDKNGVYFHERGTNNIWLWGGSYSTTCTQIDSGAMPAISQQPGLAELGSYVYVYSPSDGKVWELPKTGTPNDVLIDDFSDNTSFPFLNGIHSMVASNGKIYLLVVNDIGTMVREITPTSAAGAGFGAEIARFSGVYGRAIWAHNGILYVVGNTGFGKLGIFYLQPGGNFGSLGELEAENSSNIFGASSFLVGDILEHFLMVERDETYFVYQIDAISGNLASVAKTSVVGGSSTSGTVGGFVYRRDKYIMWSNSHSTLANRRVYQADPDGYSPSSFVISPWNDFALADEKILSSLVLSMEALPADWRVRVDYATNNNDIWTNAIDVTTTNSTGTKQAVSTDTSTVKFRTLSIRIRMDYTGVDDPPTTSPTILGVDALAMVAKPTKVWRLLLDLSDSKSRAVGVSGSRQATNLSTAADTESVVAFKDYYGSSTPGTAEEHDVIIDSYVMVLSQPGEGVAAVTLKETS